MLTVELLEEALELARRAGYRVRQEWLEGCAGGACVIKGQKWLFLDPIFRRASNWKKCSTPCGPIPTWRRSTWGRNCST